VIDHVKTFHSPSLITVLNLVGLRGRILRGPKNLGAMIPALIGCGGIDRKKYASSVNVLHCLIELERCWLNDTSVDLYTIHTAISNLFLLFLLLFFSSHKFMLLVGDIRMNNRPS